MNRLGGDGRDLATVSVPDRGRERDPTLSLSGSARFRARDLVRQRLRIQSSVDAKCPPGCPEQSEFSVLLGLLGKQKGRQPNKALTCRPFLRAFKSSRMRGVPRDCRQLLHTTSYFLGVGDLPALPLVPHGCRWFGHSLGTVRMPTDGPDGHLVRGPSPPVQLLCRLTG